MAENGGEDIVRVLRVLEYVGPRKLVEEQIELSITGTRYFGNHAWAGPELVQAQKVKGVCIRAVTLGSFPEILNAADLEQAMRGPGIVSMTASADTR